MAITEVNQIDAIGRDGNILKLLLIDFLDWEYEDMHLELLQDKISNYVAYLAEKQYIDEYGDDFSRKNIDIHFQHGITANGVELIDAISAQVNDSCIFINIHFPEM